MKLSQIHENAEDGWAATSLLRKVARELGYSDINIAQYTEEGDPDHHDAMRDVQIAVDIARTGDIETLAAAHNGVDSIRNFRLQGVDEVIVALTRLEKGPFGSLPNVKHLRAALDEVQRTKDHLQTSAKHVKEILMLISGIKAWARGDAQRGGTASETSYRSSIARAFLKKMSIPMEAK